MIIVDTNVLSEMLKAEPHQAVVDWYKSIPAERCFVTAITKAEMLAGAIILPEGRRRKELILSILDLFEQDFADRVLSFDTHAAVPYSEILFQRRKAGAPISSLDAQIAAIARDKDMAVATRNVRDFENCGVNLIDPWTG